MWCKRRPAVVASLTTAGLTVAITKSTDTQFQKDYTCFVMWLGYCWQRCQMPGRAGGEVGRHSSDSSAQKGGIGVLKMSSQHGRLGI